MGLLRPCAAALCLTWVLVPGATAQAPARLSPAVQQSLRASGKVGADLATRLGEADGVRALVLLDEETVAGSGSRAAGAAARRTAVADEVLSGLAAGDLALERRLGSAAGLVGRLSGPGLLRLAADPRVVRLEADRPVHGQLAEALPLATLDAAQGLGFSGDGVVVAVIDTGVDADHPDLADDLIAEQCFCAGCCPNGQDTQSGPGSAEDDHGHGTHVASIVTSGGVVAGPGGAPDADFLAIKVLDGGNAGSMIDVVLAADWVVTNRPDVDLIHLSLGSSTLYPGPCDDADGFTQAAAQLVDQAEQLGMLVVASAGNQGSSSSMALPACLSKVVGVGAVYDADVGSASFFDPLGGLFCNDPTTQADQVTCFTNSDDTTHLFAPGALTRASGLNGGTAIFSGTSQAAPLVTACGALVREADPGATAETLRSLLRTSRSFVTDPGNGLAYPRLDCERVLSCLLDPGSCTLAGACPATPSPSCASPGRSLLLLKDRGLNRRLVWRWLSGSENAAAFGDPTLDTSTLMCLYAEGQPVPLLEAAVGPGGLCQGKPCWRHLNGNGYSFVDRSLARQGILRLLLRAHPSKARVLAIGKGANLPLPPLPLPSGEVTAQIHSSTGPCWQQVYPAASVLKNTDELFKAKFP